MAKVSSGRYSELPKGYLTYPVTKGKESDGLKSTLLTDHRVKTYTIMTKNKVVHQRFISKEFAEAMKKAGNKILVEYINEPVGKKKLQINIDGEDITIPIEVHKIYEKGEITQLRIRVTTQTEGQLLKYMDGVQKKVAQWKIQPKECVWSQGGWTEDSKAPLIKESDIEREHKRLMNIIEDLQDKVTALEKEPMKKIIREEREVRKQIFK